MFTSSSGGGNITTSQTSTKLRRLKAKTLATI